MLYQNRPTQITAIQDFTMRLQLKCHQKNKPTMELLSETKSISIYQRGVEILINQAKKIIMTGKPINLAKKLITNIYRKGNMRV